MVVRDALQAQLATALRNRDTAVVAALRSTLSALANAEAVPVPGVAAEGARAPGTAGPGIRGEAPDQTTDREAARQNARQAHDVTARLATSALATTSPGLGATEVPRREVLESVARGIVAQEAAGLRAHAERLHRLCRLDDADAARRAADLLIATLRE
jgi:hypothetical protein